MCLESRDVDSENSIRAKFFGRKKEMQRLSMHLDNLTHGQGALVMIVGEPGIGKTRTAEAFEVGARDLGIDVFWGRCYEGEGAPLYWPWIQILRHYLSLYEDEEISGHAGHGLPAIASVVSGFAIRFPGLPELPAIEDPISSRFRFFDSLSTLFVALAKIKPIVLILDDLHWADASSLLFLEFINHNISGSPIAIVGTCRDSELSRTHPLFETLGALMRVDVFDRVALRGLTLEDVRDMLSEVYDISERELSRVAEEIHERTEGNPFFVAEVLRLMREEAGASVSNSIRDAILPRTRVPEGIFEAIGRRLNRLSDGSTALLAPAAVVGREFHLEVMRRLIPDIDEQNGKPR